MCISDERNVFSKDQKHRKMSFITLFSFILKLFKFQSHNGIKIHLADVFQACAYCVGAKMLIHPTDKSQNYFWCPFLRQTQNGCPLFNPFQSFSHACSLCVVLKHFT